MAKVKAIPEGYATITPYLTLKNPAEAIEFYKKALGATEIMKLDDGKGGIMHAEIKIGNSILMMSGENQGMKEPAGMGGTPVSFMVYVEDVDAAAKVAETNGMKTLRPVANQFYGDRTGTFQDPYGYIWSIGTHVEDIPPELMKQKVKEMAEKGGMPN